MSAKVEVLIETEFNGKGTTQAKKELDKLSDASTTVGKNFLTLKGNATAMVGALAGVAAGAAAAYSAFKQGATLNAAASAFDNLAESINTTGDSLLGKLRDATKGMVSDADLIAGATDIINTGLASTEDEAVRLATAVSTLGLDMQQVILTFANNSTARLDSLGLAISDVTTRAKELEAQGLDADKAFDTAVLEGLEAKMTLLGDASETTAGKIAQLETKFINLKNAILETVASSDTLNNALDTWLGLVDIAQQAAKAEADAETVLKRAWEEGNISLMDRTTILNGAKNGSEKYVVQLQEIRAAQKAVDAQIELSVIAQSELNDLRQDGIKAARDARTADEEYFSQLHDTVRVNEDLNDKTQQRNNLLDESTAFIENANAANRAHFDAMEQERAATEQAALALHEYNTRLSEGAFNALPALTQAEQDFTNQLFEQASQLGVTAEQFALLAMATGDYTNEQITAALKTQLMNEKVAELAAAVADGSISVATAVSELQRYSDEIDSLPEVVTVKFKSDVSEFAIPGGFSGTPTTAPGRIGGVAMAGGGDFIVPPGYPNDSFPVRVQSGERVTVTPAGQSSSMGANVTVNVMGAMNPMATANAVASRVANVLGGAN